MNNTSTPPADRDSPVVVHLVHGTFPRGILQSVAWNLAGPFRWWRRSRGSVKSPYPNPHPQLERRFWFEPDSPFERDLRERLDEKVDISFDRFLWSGNNSFTARTEAAEGLREHLDRARSERPNHRHLIVAHSHGGTATVMAIDHDDPELPARADGVITLATPFVWLAPRYGSNVPEFRAVVAGFLPRALLSLAPLLAVVAWLRADSATGIWLSGLAFVGGLLGLGLRQPLIALVIVVTLLAFGHPALRSDVWAISIVSLFVGVLLAGDWSPLAIKKTRNLAQQRANSGSGLALCTEFGVSTEFGSPISQPDTTPKTIPSPFQIAIASTGLLAARVLCLHSIQFAP